MPRPIEEIQAGDEFRQQMIEKADIRNHDYPAWHGWVIMDAFLAGIDWARDAAHASDCATHNAPAKPAGECDCK